MGTARQPASINGIEFDALINQSESYEAEVPEYPTENGYSVSDSIILKPRNLDVTVYVTDTPVTWRRRFGGNRSAKSVLEELKRLYFTKELVTFRTTDGSYPNMGIISLTIPKTPESGNAYEVSIKLKEVPTTATKTVAITVSYGRGGSSGANAGTANTSTTASGKGGGSSATQSKKEGKKASSILYGVANSAGIFK